MTNTHSGSCRCGAVTYEIEGEFKRFFLCHCKRCRKASGSSNAANLFASDAKLTWLSGEDLIKTYVLPGTRHGRSFCTECGAMLPRQRDGTLMVPAGSLDTPVDIRPEAHIFLEFKAEWDDHLEDVAKLDGPPS